MLSEIAWSCAVLLVVHVVGLQVVRRARVVVDTDKTRWFVTHGFCNVCTGCMSMWDALYDDNVYRTLPLYLSVALHAYHLLCYREISHADFMHHTVFMPLLAVPGIVWDWGPFASSFQLIFINGFPGALLYGIAAWQRLRCVHHKIGSAVTIAVVNTCVRMPGILYAQYYLWHHIPDTVPRVIVYTQLAFAPLNAMYYAFESWTRLARAFDGGSKKV